MPCRQLAVVMATAVAVVSAVSVRHPNNDPSDSWMSYAEFAAGALITGFNATVTVPDRPRKEFGASPSFWYGLQTATGDGALVQPILAWGQRESGFGIFLEVFDWTDERDTQSPESYAVPPGDTLRQSVQYVADTNSYDMYIHSKATGKSISMNYKLLPGQRVPETSAFIVVEHSPMNCAEFPANGNVTFTDISIAVNGVKTTPRWEAKQQRPACGSKALVQPDGSVVLTWQP
eukprot:CAMPEP_0182927124 /NCGR_PEP_ID=MMETSP0105_2-20130417/13272_1 /TAXON_ID=81532 ORGANISM="Acanthoeca-like sp., Strain 10tr" /NCGR_SAMPLE_ID=MMETSP0105_2 /ASSEMBLY_ACC=CAM_ASM_000205 /LENGTH=232 /DNA_ID=CAMNT_0025065051 /DNA_START=24 /DNA_END=722 /DNA_ORIENTATION=+